MGMDFVSINVSTTGLYATNTSDYGTVAIVGNGSTSNTDPILIGSVSEASSTFGTSDLGLGIIQALRNGAAKVWAVETGTPTLATVKAALAKILDYDVQLVAMADIVETADDAYVSDALLNHVLAAGTDRIGVFQLAKAEDASTMPTAISALVTGNSSRLVGIAHNSTSDVACSLAGLIAGLKPQQGIVLKSLENVTQSVGFTRTQINALEALHINVLIKATYTTGLTISNNLTLGSDVSGLSYIDSRRVVDDVSYILKSKLTDPNIIGEVRINKTGLSVLLNKLSGTLQNLVNAAEIDEYSVNIPILNALSKDESQRSDAENTLISTAGSSRTVAGQVIIKYRGVLQLINLDVTITV